MAELGYAKGRTTRRRIVDHAAALFGEVGFRSASLREIAARSGVTHPGLLHHFPTKELLLLAVLEQRDADDLPLSDADRDDGAAFLAAVVRVVERNEQRRAIVELYTTLSAESIDPAHPAHDYFVARYRWVVERAVAAYDDLGQRGLLRAGIEPAMAARQLVALMDGLQVQWLIDPRTEMAGTVRALIASQLVAGA